MPGLAEEGLAWQVDFAHSTPPGTGGAGQVKAEAEQGGGTPGMLSTLAPGTPSTPGGGSPGRRPPRIPPLPLPPKPPSRNLAVDMYI